MGCMVHRVHVCPSSIGCMVVWSLWHLADPLLLHLRRREIPVASIPHSRLMASLCFPDAAGAVMTCRLATCSATYLTSLQSSTCRFLVVTTCRFGCRCLFGSVRGSRTMRLMLGASVHRRMSLPHLVAMSSSPMHAMQIGHAMRIVPVASAASGRLLQLSPLRCAMHLGGCGHLWAGSNHGCRARPSWPEALVLRRRALLPLALASLHDPTLRLVVPRLMHPIGCCSSHSSRRCSKPSPRISPPLVAAEDPVSKGPSPKTL